MSVQLHCSEWNSSKVLVTSPTNRLAFSFKSTSRIQVQHFDSNPAKQTSPGVAQNIMLVGDKILWDVSFYIFWSVIQCCTGAEDMSSGLLGGSMEEYLARTANPVAKALAGISGCGTFQEGASQVWAVSRYEKQSDHPMLLKPPLWQCALTVCKAVKFFSKLINLFFGYFDPSNILFDTKNK